MSLFDDLEFEAAPLVEIEVLRVVHDDADCVAVERIVHRLDLQAAGDPNVVVMEASDGVWLISYVGGGWTCDGPHPFDS